MPGLITDLLAWLTIGLFTTGMISEYYERSVARNIFVSAWIVFAVFWALLVPHFIYEIHSFIEGGGSLLAVPASIYIAYLLYTGRASLVTISRAVGVMGLVYLPFAAITPLREFLVELVSTQLYLTLTTLGYRPEFTIAEANGFHSAFIFTDTSGHRYLTYLVLGCTGIGSMSIISGLVAAVNAPLRRKAQTLAVVLPTIWLLNLIRNVFIALGFGKQWFQIFVDPIMALVGYTDPAMVSFFIADRILAQSLSVAALLFLIWFIGHYMPEVLSILEEVLYVFTKQEYDLRKTLRHT